MRSERYKGINHFASIIFKRKYIKIYNVHIKLNKYIIIIISARAAEILAARSLRASRSELNWELTEERIKNKSIKQQSIHSLRVFVCENFKQLEKQARQQNRERETKFLFCLCTKWIMLNILIHYRS